MTKKYKQPRIPVEFISWAQVRQRNIQGVVNRIGIKKRIPMTEVLRMIAKTDGIEIDDRIIGDHVKKRRRKNAI